MANTTWNPADRANVTLSNGNLTVSNATTHGGVRTVNGYSVGKYYFEYSTTGWTTALGIGVANASAVLTTVASNVLNASITNSSGAIAVNSGTNLGNIGSSSAIVGIALDLTNNLIWYRTAPSGNWNGSGTANPATPAGGFSISAIATGPIYGLVCATVLANFSVIANFGGSAFSGAVPSGFTAGLPALVRAFDTAVTVNTS